MASPSSLSNTTAWVRTGRDRGRRTDHSQGDAALTIWRAVWKSSDWAERSGTGASEGTASICGVN
jgi:hypothetical protein